MSIRPRDISTPDGMDLAYWCAGWEMRRKGQPCPRPGFTEWSKTMTAAWGVCDAAMARGDVQAAEA